MKEAVGYLGANKTEKAIQRIDRAIGTVVPILAQFDNQNQVHMSSSRHARPDAKKDVLIVVDELVKSPSFVVEKG